MDPLTAAGLGLSIYGQLKQASANRKALRERASLTRERVQELELRSKFNIQALQSEGAMAQRDTMAAMAGSGFSVGGASSLARMTQIANDIAKEVTIRERETASQVKALRRGAQAQESRARQMKSETWVNLLGSTGMQLANYYQINAESGDPSPNVGVISGSTSGGGAMREPSGRPSSGPALLDIGV